MSTFLAVYLFYLLPAIEIVYGAGLHERIGMMFTIILWLVFNRLAVLYMIWGFNRREESGTNKFAVLALPAIILVGCAILI